MKIVLLWLMSTAGLLVFTAKVDSKCQLVPGYGLIVRTSLCPPTPWDEMGWKNEKNR